jgi:predicted Rossmann fold flavoprotein
MSSRLYDLIIIGGGAAGFFAAIQVSELDSRTRILIIEKSGKVLSKVKVSGGGRCNVTHSCFNPFSLATHYPRGEKLLKEIFKRFNAGHMVEWLQAKGVPVKAEEDGRMFPITDDSQTIIDCFMQEVSRHEVAIKMSTAATALNRADDEKIEVACNDGHVYYARKVLVAIGGNPKPEAYEWLKDCGHHIKNPVPSLFTFNDPTKHFVDLMGVSVPSAEVKIVGTKFHQRGPLLITHWGLSGPAVIKLSAWAALFLHEQNYNFNILVNWTDFAKEEELRNVLQKMRELKPRQRVANSIPFQFPSRLWEKLCRIAGIDDGRIWGELSNKGLNKLLENLFRCSFSIRGKTTFKEEFVTCGGIDLSDINPETMESRRFRGLYFAGEVLNIDGETGGFNFQSAWSTAYVAAQAIAEKAPVTGDQ